MAEEYAMAKEPGGVCFSGVFEVEPLEVVAIGLEVQEEAFDLPA
jgi:hypothetical protein